MKIEQILHGYRHGHALLASSVQLSANDNQLMAILSDWTEYKDVLSNDNSYITSYRLLDKPFYVIAKSWYADEMSRPGCVWTHSLLIYEDDLKNIDDFRKLSNLFKRPSIDESTFDSYNHTLQVSLSDLKNPFIPLLLGNSYIDDVLYCLLYDKGPLVFKNNGFSSQYEQLCLYLMNAIPSHMLMNRTFCSGCTRLPRYKDLVLDIVFSTSYSSVPDFFDYQSSELIIPSWIQFVGQYLRGNNLNIADVIKYVSDDVQNNVHNLEAILSSLSILFSEKTTDESDSYFKAIYVLAQQFPDAKDAQSIKSFLLSQNVWMRYCPPRAFVVGWAMCKQYSSFADLDKVIIDAIKQMATQDRDSLYACMSVLSSSMLQDVSNINSSILCALSSALDDEMLTKLSIDNVDAYLSLLAINHELLANLHWLSNPLEVRCRVWEIFINGVPNSFDQWDIIAEQILMENVPVDKMMLQVLLDKSNNVLLFKVLTCLNKNVLNTYSKNAISIVCASVTADDIIAWLLSQKQLSKQFVVFMPYIIDANSRCWQRYAIENFQFVIASITNFVDENLDLVVYAYNLTFNWTLSKITIPCYSKVFNIIYPMIINNDFPWPAWNQIVRHTSDVFFWQEWDHGKKMRQMVVERYKQAKFPRESVLSFSKYPKLNKELFDLW